MDAPATVVQVEAACNEDAGATDAPRADAGRDVAQEEAAPGEAAVTAEQEAPAEGGEAAPVASAGGEAAAAGAGAEGPAKAQIINLLRKRKVALFMAYVGHGYSGMQRNPGAKTIEEDLFKALHAAGAISDANSDDAGFTKIHWMRAARTDKGVSAVGQVVSAKLVLEPPGLVERLNEHLAPQIRVFGYCRATNGFDARKHCDKRRYEYILPEWAFDPTAAVMARPRAAAAAAAQPADAAGGSEAGGAQSESAAGPVEGAGAPAEAAVPPAEGAAQEPAAAVEGADAPAEAAVPPAEGAAEEPSAAAAAAPDSVSNPAPAEGSSAAAAAPGGGQATRQHALVEDPFPTSTFVFDDACANRLSGILSLYEGTHNFHNFTVRKPFNAADAKRYMLSFRCTGTMEIDGRRWVKMVVIGQSFMLHQIRKMIGMAVAVMRGTAPESCLKLALHSKADINVPMAPELGLFLDECYYAAYNNQYADLHEHVQLERYAAEVEAFKAQQLYPHISKRDREELVNAGWLRSVHEGNFRFREWQQNAEDWLQRFEQPQHSGKQQGNKRPHSGGRGDGGRRPYGGGRGDGGKRARQSLPPPVQRSERGGDQWQSAPKVQADYEYSD